MIVVIGSLRLRGSGANADVAGLAASIASAAAADGSIVEVITRLGDDPAGDAVGLALTRRHIGHVAVLRDPARPTAVAGTDGEERDPAPAEDDPENTMDLAPRLEAEDANLALRYLPQISVIVAVHLAGDVLLEAVDAASWAETALLVVVPPGADVPDGLPKTAVTLAVEDSSDSAIGGSIGRYAAALDRGETARDAYDALVASVPS
jgi:sugar/nucleoside kinase (ribokinase family)